jgi:hypothetical protein
MRAVSWTVPFWKSQSLLVFLICDLFLTVNRGWSVCTTGVLSERRVSSELFADEILQENMNNRTTEKLTRVRVVVVSY